MVVLVTCKNEEDPIKNKGARVVTACFFMFFFYFIYFSFILSELSC